MSRREKWSLGAAAALGAVLVVVVVMSMFSSSRSSARGCIDVMIPYSVGGQELYRCGAGARFLCSGVGRPGGFSGAAGAAVAAGCRKAGLRTGT